MYKKPDYLKAGDKVMVLSPAGAPNHKSVNEGIGILKGWGLEVILAQNTLNNYGSLAGKDEERIADLQLALDDTSIKAIICSRGGYGTTRIVDALDWTTFEQSPKWLVGYSDITTMHMQLYKLGYQSIHGSMVIHYSLPHAASSGESLRQVLFGEKPPVITAPAHQFNRKGEAEGSIIGGNLALLASQIGTPADLDYTDKILFIEEIGEYLYNFDRMLVQMKRSGKLEKLRGLVIGQLTDMKTNEGNEFPMSALEIIEEKLSEYDYPVGYGFDIGHDYPNWPVICGGNAVLKVTDDGATLIQL
ncbi:LD-carboxypeptidase [Limibacter armeniacum]|uniref:S66 peptidase family protein n=1 Tax=Limibacter armeniacum TaxID=466084 RepID=UPI002FE51571